jgi:septal ring factor EnvC (AmiA/AmiB activator)
MLKKSFITKIGVSSLLVAFVLFVSSCTSKITEEQLQQLNELRKQERSLTEMIDKKKQQKSRLEQELKSRQVELDDCTKKKEFVQDKLSKWPDIWPDYKPEGK